MTNYYLHHMQVITKTIALLLHFLFLAFGFFVCYKLGFRLTHKTCLTHPIIPRAILWGCTLNHYSYLFTAFDTAVSITFPCLFDGVDAVVIVCSRSLLVYWPAILSYFMQIDTRIEASAGVLNSCIFTRRNQYILKLVVNERKNMEKWDKAS